MSREQAQTVCGALAAGARTAHTLGARRLASLALSGRANVRDIDSTDEEVARRSARHLVRRLLPPTEFTP